MARRVAYLVFLIPVVISVPIAAYVLYDIVQQPGRGLNMIPSVQISTHSNSVIDFVDVSSSYSINEPLNIEAKITDNAFDCGDVYMTIYDSSDKAIAQNAFFNQCFSKNQSIVPIGDTFSESLDKAGKYTVILDILDKNQENSEYASVTVNVVQ